MLELQRLKQYPGSVEHRPDVAEIIPRSSCVVLPVEELHKSNSTAGAVQVEANLQEQLSNHFHFGQERTA